MSDKQTLDQDWLQNGSLVPVNMETTARLVSEVRQLRVRTAEIETRLADISEALRSAEKCLDGWATRARLSDLPAACS